MKYAVFFDSAYDNYSMFSMFGGIFDNPEDAQKRVDELSKKYKNVFQVEIEENKPIELEIMNYIE